MEIDDADRFDLTGKIVIRGRAPEFIGSYSLVYRGKWGESTVAVKVIRSVGALSTMRRKLRRERTVWEALDHPNILPFYGHADDEEFEPFGAFISPWCSNGDVGRFLELYGRDMETVERVELWKGVLSGVAFLHSRNPVIVHGDLKPGNILVDDKKIPRICDFGLSRIIQEGGTGGMTTTTEHTGTERYLAPELVTTNRSIPTTQSDAYAIGCLGLELIYLERPYAHRQNNHHGCIIIDIREGIPPAYRQEDVHSPLDFWWGSLHSWQLIEGFWRPYPAERPTAATAMEILTTSSDGPDNAHILGGVTMQHYDTGVEIRVQSTSDQERDEMIARALRRRALQRERIARPLRSILALDRPESSQRYASASRPLHPTPAAAINAGRFLGSRPSLRSSPSTSPTPSPPSSPSTSAIPSPSSPLPSPSLSPPTAPSQSYPSHLHYLQTNSFTPNLVLLAGPGGAPKERRTDKPLRRHRDNIAPAQGTPAMLPPSPHVRSSSSFQFTSRGYPEGGPIYQRTVENARQTSEDGEAVRVPKTTVGDSDYSRILPGRRGSRY